MPDRTPGGLFLPDADALALITGPAPAKPPFASPVEPDPTPGALRLEAGAASPYLVTDAERWLVELDGPELFTFAREPSLAELIAIAESAAAVARPFVVVAPSFATDALAMLVVNKLRGILNVGAVITPRPDDVKSWLGARALARVVSGSSSTVFSAR
ncbi:MAG: hypothetical protein U0228_22300 [Myxococcaceae bacterium]